jgi:hypothetical protein
MNLTVGSTRKERYGVDKHMHGDLYSWLRRHSLMTAVNETESGRELSWWCGGSAVRRPFVDRLVLIVLILWRIVCCLCCGCGGASSALILIPTLNARRASKLKICISRQNSTPNPYSSPLSNHITTDGQLLKTFVEIVCSSSSSGDASVGRKTARRCSVQRISTMRDRRIYYLLNSSVRQQISVRSVVP